MHYSPVIGYNFRSNFNLFSKASFFAHSCLPNCEFIISTSDSRGPHPSSFQAHVAIPEGIRKGEPLTLNYYAGHLATSATHLRQNVIKSGARFICSCPRCKDPTEGGSNLSTLWCPNPICRKTLRRNSPLLPETPQNQIQKWSCNSCNFSADLEYVEKIEKNMQQGVEPFLYSGTEFLKAYEYLDHLGVSLVHPNFHGIFELQRRLCSFLCNIRPPKEETLEWDKHLQGMEYILKILNIIRPGITMDRGINDYRIYAF